MMLIIIGVNKVQRKILIITMIFLLIMMMGVFAKKIYEDKGEVFNKELTTFLNDFKDLSTKVSRYEIKKVGKLSISANYKGAHGENFPHDFEFNYALKGNKIYFENKDGYNSLNLNKDLIDVLKSFNKKIEVDKVRASNSTINFTTATLNLNVEYINNLYKTSFKNITATVYFNNFLSKNVEKTVIKIDDIVITKIGKSYIIDVDDYNIKFNFNKSGYSININDDIKMNVFNETTNDRYTLVVGKYVYSFTVREDGIDFVASTGASIYNSFNVVAQYDDIELNLNKELDIEKNPITRYFSEVK